jgi:hypothetical protein
MAKPKLTITTKNFPARKKQKPTRSKKETVAEEQNQIEECPEADENQATSLEQDVFIQKIHSRPIDGKYLLQRKLGQGGYGAVYLGKRRVSLGVNDTSSRLIPW